MFRSPPIPADGRHGDIPSTGPAPDARYVELIAESLREACERQSPATLALIARVIDQHIAGSLQPRRVGRWRDEALDGLLTLISPAMQARIRKQGAASPGTHA